MMYYQDLVKILKNTQSWAQRAFRVAGWFRPPLISHLLENLDNFAEKVDAKCELSQVDLLIVAKFILDNLGNKDDSSMPELIQLFGKGHLQNLQRYQEFNLLCEDVVAAEIGISGYDELQKRLPFILSAAKFLKEQKLGITIFDLFTICNANTGFLMTASGILRQNVEKFCEYITLLYHLHAQDLLKSDNIAEVIKVFSLLNSATLDYKDLLNALQELQRRNLCAVPVLKILADKFAALHILQKNYFQTFVQQIIELNDNRHLNNWTLALLNVKSKMTLLSQFARDIKKLYQAQVLPNKHSLIKEIFANCDDLGLVDILIKLNEHDILNTCAQPIIKTPCHNIYSVLKLLQFFYPEKNATEITGLESENFEHLWIYNEFYHHPQVENCIFERFGKLFCLIRPYLEVNFFSEVSKIMKFVAHEPREVDSAKLFTINYKELMQMYCKCALVKLAKEQTITYLRLLSETDCHGFKKTCAKIKESGCNAIWDKLITTSPINEILKVSEWELACPGLDLSHEIDELWTRNQSAMKLRYAQQLLPAPIISSKILPSVVIPSPTPKLGQSI